MPSPELSNPPIIADIALLHHQSSEAAVPAGSLGMGPGPHRANEALTSSGDLMVDAPWSFGANAPGSKSGGQPMGVAEWWRQEGSKFRAEYRGSRLNGGLIEHESKNLGVLALDKQIQQSRKDDLRINRAEARHIRRQERAERREELKQTVVSAAKIAVGGLRKVTNRFGNRRHVPVQTARS